MARRLASCASVMALGLGVPAAAHANADAAVTLTPALGDAGTRVLVRGDGFRPEVRVLVTQQGRRPIHLRTNRRGRFRARLTIRPAASGAHPIVTVGPGRRVVNRFQVSPRVGPARTGERATSRGVRLRWTPTEGADRAFVALDGRGFGRRRVVRVRFGRHTAMRARANARGRFSARFTVRSSRPGRTAVTVRSRRARLGFSFAVRRDPVIAAAGDIACDPADPEFNAGNGTPAACRARQTSDLVLALRPAAVLALGDLQYEDGALDDYPASYAATWGRFKGITWPVMGNHDNGGGSATGYFGFFGPRVGTYHRAFYSFDVGAWHLIALNSNYENCGELGGVDCADAAVQQQWLRADLAEHPNRCVLAYFHYPRFSSGDHGDYATVKPLWDALHAGGADVVLNGHDHDYERFAPQDPAGAPAASGIREFVVGTGGKDFRGFPIVRANSEMRNKDTHGVLKLTLRAGSYDWEFVPEAGRTFRDAGSAACH